MGRNSKKTNFLFYRCIWGTFYRCIGGIGTPYPYRGLVRGETPPEPLTLKQQKMERKRYASETTKEAEFQGRNNVDKVVTTEGPYKGSIAYFTEKTSLLDYMESKDYHFGKPYVSKKGTSTLLLGRKEGIPNEARWISPNLGITTENLKDNVHCLAICESWNPTANQWLPVVVWNSGNDAFQGAVRLR